MILEIVQYGHPILRQRCSKVTEVDEELINLIGDMLDTMVDANGVGLAAPQVGVPIRLAVIDVAHDPECVSYLRVNGEEVALGADGWVTNPRSTDTDGDGVSDANEINAVTLCSQALDPTRRRRG